MNVIEDTDGLLHRCSHKSPGYLINSDSAPHYTVFAFCGFYLTSRDDDEPWFDAVPMCITCVHKEQQFIAAEQVMCDAGANDAKDLLRWQFGDIGQRL